MATVASILGQPEFDINAAGGSISGGNPGAAGSINGSDGTSTNDDRSGDNGGRDADATRRVINPADATRADDDNDRNDSRRSNTRSARSSSARASADTRARSRKETSEENLDVTALLVVLHSILSRVLDAPEFEITEQEAKLLGTALKRVMKYVTKTVLSPMQEAVAALLVIVLAIYLPRFWVYSARTDTKGKVINATPVA